MNPSAAPASAPAPAPTRTRVLAQARFETSTLLRNGEQLLVAMVFPLLALGGLAFTTEPSLGPGDRLDGAVPGVLALAIVSTAFTGQAISTAFDRRHGVLRYLGVTPLGRSGLLIGKALAVLSVEILQFIIIAAAALALGWSPSAFGLLASLPFWLAGSWAFVALALILAGTLRAEGVLAVANLIWVLLAGLGALVIPSSALPPALAKVVVWLPSGALGDGLRAAMATQTFDWVAIAVLLLWGAGATAVAVRVFNWSG